MIEPLESQINRQKEKAKLQEAVRQIADIAESAYYYRADYSEKEIKDILIKIIKIASERI